MPKKRHTAKPAATAVPTRPPEMRVRRRRSGKRLLESVWLWAGIGAVLVIVAMTLLIFRPSQSVTAQITAAEAYEKYQAGAFFLDVRTQEEWTQGHVEKSTLIPLDELPNRLQELPRDQDIVVVCRSGVRSKEGATILRQAGFDRVSCLTGGLQAWVGAGYPVKQ